AVLTDSFCLQSEEVVTWSRPLFDDYDTKNIIYEQNVNNGRS
ncbi:hypothetical protein EDAG_05728, partial [Enterococcus faecium D344SRF]